MSHVYDCADVLFEGGLRITFVFILSKHTVTNSN